MSETTPSSTPAPPMLPPALPSVSQQPAWSSSIGWRRDIITWVLALALGGGGGFASSQIDSAAQDARREAQLTELTRRVGVVEGRLDGVEALRREGTALAATVGAQTASLERRLDRIETAIDRDRGLR